jgi:hypothetical protein
MLRHQERNCGVGIESTRLETVRASEPDRDPDKEQPGCEDEKRASLLGERTLD